MTGQWGGGGVGGVGEEYGLKEGKRTSLRDSVTRFFASGFFHESPSPRPLKMTLGSYRIFSEIFLSQGAPP